MRERHCPTCHCETPGAREAREQAERAERERKQREADFVRRHSVLTDEDLEWASKMRRAHTPKGTP